MHTRASMHFSMDDSGLGSISSIEAFLKSVDGAITFSLEKKGYANKMYGWIDSTLVRLRYDRVTKKERGIILSYLHTMTNLARSAQEVGEEEKEEAKADRGLRQYLKNVVTTESLAALSASESNNECAENMQKAKTTLFKTFTKC